MKHLLTFLRGSLHTIAGIVIVGVVVLYLAVHFNLAGMLVEHALEKELGEKLGTKVTVEGETKVDWFNQVVLDRLTLYDLQGDTLLHARRVLVAYDIWAILSHHLVLNTCQLIDFDIRTYRESPEDIPNYQFLIDALKKKDPDSQPFIRQFDLNSILLRQGSLSYHVRSKPHLAVNETPIDPNHIQIEKLSANLHLHDERLTIKKFHCVERKTQFSINRSEVALNLAELRKRATDQELQLISLKGLEAENDMLTAKADARYTTQGLTLQLRELDLPYGHPRLKGIHELHASASLKLSQLERPLDSLQLEATIDEMHLRMDTLGQVNATGQLVGMPCQATLKGQLKCLLGEVSIDTHIEFPRKTIENASFEKRELILQGHCQTPRFAIGKLLPPKAELGNTAIDADFKVLRSPGKPLLLAINGDVRKLEWREHTFRDIELNVEGNLNKLKGFIALNDSLCSASANVDIDLSKKQRQFKVIGSVSHLNPNALKLTKVSMLDSVSISGLLNADVMASNFLDAEGSVLIDQLMIEKGEQRLELEPITFEGTARRGLLRSPIAIIDYERDKQNGNYHLMGGLPIANDLCDILALPFRMEKQGHFDLNIDANQNITRAHAELPSVDLLQGRHAAAVLDMTGDTAKTLFPTLTFVMSSPSHGLEGTLRGRVVIQPTLDLVIEPTTLLYNRKKPIKLTNAHIWSTPEGDIMVENFQMRGENQGIAAYGALGKDGDKRFLVSLDNFDLGPICSNLKKNYLHFGGQASGDIMINSHPSLRLTTDSLKIRNFSYIDTLVGDGSFNVDYQIAENAVEIKADIETHKRYHNHIECDLLMGKSDSIDLRCDTDHLPLGWLNNWTGNILQQLSGDITGKARLCGAFSRLDLEGTPDIDVRFTHNMIGAHFHIRDKVTLKPGLIALRNAYVDDCHGHPLTLNAKVEHTYLRHFLYDVTVDMPNNREGFLALDRKEQPGRLYWGQLYAKGHANLRGGNGKHRFNLNVGTTEKSCFFLSPYAQDIDPDQAAYSFLTFRDKAKLEQDTLSLKQDGNAEASVTKLEDRTDLQVDLQINATEQCEVRLKIDPLSDDELIGRGNGNLSVRYDPTRDITLAGIYHITDGTYTMSMKGDVMSKTFQLQNTSKVSFNGVPSQAELDLECRYHIPSVNLNDLDQSITAVSGMSRSTVPVDCKMNVTGQLSAPKVSFDFELKNVSDQTNTMAQNAISDRQTKEQEVLYLLFFSKFFTPQYAQSSQSRNGSSELTSLASSSITAQLNQLLGRVSDNFSMGTNVRSDKGDFSDVEMDLSVTTHLLGDRLQLSGNLGYRDPAHRLGTMSNNTTSVIGDFDLEWLVNASGTTRIKAYSHYNERDYTINNALTTQGIGFIWLKDFGKLHYPKLRKQPTKK